MFRLRAGTSLLAVAALAGVLVGCGSDAEVEGLRADVSRLTAQRDALRAEVDAAGERHEKTVAVVEGIRAVLDDPSSVGSEEDVASALASFATADAVMEDAVLGSAPMRQAWQDTLYGGAMDAEITVLHQWVSPDGSQSGGLWVWRGTNLAGNSFELLGVQVDDHDLEGRVTHELVAYPYDDAYVLEAVEGAGSPPVDGLARE